MQKNVLVASVSQAWLSSCVYMYYLDILNRNTLYLVGSSRAMKKIKFKHCRQPLWNNIVLLRMRPYCRIERWDFHVLNCRDITVSTACFMLELIKGSVIFP